MLKILPLRLPGFLFWIAALVLLGFLLPRFVGAALFDPNLLLAYSFLSIPFLSPLACQAVAQRRYPLSWTVAAAALFGWVSSLLLIALRILGANRQIQAPSLVMPDLPVLLSLSLIALASSLFGASLAAILTLSTGKADTAMRIMRSGFLLILLAIVFMVRNGSNSIGDFISSQLTYSAMPKFAIIISLILLAHAVLLLTLSLRRASRLPTPDS